jgi:hypothetical protein
MAEKLWIDARPIAGSAAEIYLRRRGITCALPGTLRFAPSCWHLSAKYLPALVAKLEGAPAFAVHRTYLGPDGDGKADVSVQKVMLGPCAGGAVRLSRGPGPLVVAEGIETAFSLASGVLWGPASVWAALSNSGLKRLNLPARPERLIIASDGDAVGRAAAHDLAERASGCGWQVSLLPADDGEDWNDYLIRKRGIA